MKRFLDLTALFAALFSIVSCSAQAGGGDTGGSHDASDTGSDIVAADAPSSATCNQGSTCSSCAAITGCGWCTTTSRCLPGDPIGSTDGTCTGAAWDMTGDLCGVPDDAGTDSGTSGNDAGTSSHDSGSGGCVPTVPRGGEDTDALCNNGIDDDCNGYTDCNDYNCSRNPAVTVCSGSHDAGTSGCVPTVPRGGEDTDALCSNGIDDDCNGYTDCNDYHCSRNAAVTVCGGTLPDAGTTDSGGPPPPPPVDAGPVGPIGPNGGTVGLMHFGVFGDVRPAANNSTIYPTAIITSVMLDMNDLGAQFAAAQGDYMFATDASVVTSNIHSLLTAESNFTSFIFHGMGNHECTGATSSNCPNGNETPNVQQYMSMLNAGHANPYFDWVIQTSMGPAHFISTAPNAWSTAQESWLNAALQQSATYTFVLAHEPPTGTQGPGSGPIETILNATPGITLRLYGHTHEYRHITGNEVIDGNAGAPLQTTSSTGEYYGFAIVDQRSDGNIVLTAYQIGTPPMVMDSFVVTPTGTLTH